MKQFFAIFLLSFVASGQVLAQQCFPQQGPGFFSSGPNYAGGQFQNRALLAPAQAFQPQQYYFPQGNVQLSQPPFLRGGMSCFPMFMNRPFQTSFGSAQMRPPSFMQTALPYLGQGLSGLVDYFEGRPKKRGQSYDDFLADRGRSSSSSSRIDNEGFYSPPDSDEPQEIPDSNSAGASGMLNVGNGDVEPLPNPDTSPPIQSDADTEPAPGPNPNVRPRARPDTEPAPGPNPDFRSRGRPDTELALGPNPDVRPRARPDTEPAQGPNPDVRPRGRPDTKLALGPNPDVRPRARPDTELAQGPNPDVRPRARPDTGPAQGPDIGTAPQLGPMPKIDTSTNGPDRAAIDEESGLDLTKPGQQIPLEELEVPVPDTLPQIPPQDAIEDAVTQIEKLPEQAQAPLAPEGCLDMIREQAKNNSPLQGAYRVMATFYQDCGSIAKILGAKTPLPELNVSFKEAMNKIKTRQLKPEELENYFNEHPYLKDRNFNELSPQCRDLRDAPPVFSYGAKPRYRGGVGGMIDLFRDQAASGICKYANVACNSHPVTALDCSGFIHAALKASGLKIEKGSEHPHYSTIAMNDIAMKENTCLEELSFSAENTLAAGDIISQSNHHMFMISSTGEDPLGVKKALKNGDCSSINRDDFDFTFIQSGSSRSIGVAHLSSGYPDVSSTVFNNLMAMAHETCERAQSGEGRLRARTRNGRSSMVVMRHVGDADPDCVEESKPKLEGEECVEDCLNES